MDTKYEILEYINQNSNNGALLVTGKWGCGKTYLIQDIRRKNKRNKNIDTI